jgi:hypothetical protein
MTDFNLWMSASEAKQTWMFVNWSLSVITTINDCGMRDLLKLLEAIILFHSSSYVCWRN